MAMAARAIARARGVPLARAAARFASRGTGRGEEEDERPSIFERDMFTKMREGSERIVIDATSEDSFSVDRVEYSNSIICLSKYVLSWGPKTFEEITPESLSILDILTPTPDILVLGTGNVTKFPSKEVKDFLKSRGIKVESVDSMHAAIAFNYMNVEYRDVVAALLPCGKEPELPRLF